MHNIKPHWAWFLLGPAVLVAGGIGALVLMAGGLMSVAEGMQRVDVPGEAVVHIDAPGEQPVFFEQRGMQAGVPAGLKIEITPVTGGEPLTVADSFGNVTYNMNGVSGRDVGKVFFPAPGDYRVATNVPLGAGGGQVALGGNPGGKIVGSILGFFGLGFGSFLACVIIMIVVAVKRSRNRKLVMQQYHAAYPPPGGMPPPPPGAQAG
ncbi:MAG: hypothetical protein H6841_10170 [Planctomycetes bacterium]|nr:hypothetical protein [Planctomycetota bacterium]